MGKRVWVFFVVFFCVSAGASAADVSASAVRLARASNDGVLTASCAELIAPLFETVPFGSDPQRTPDGDAAFAALSSFVANKHPVEARIRCTRYLANVTNRSISAEGLSASAYAADANAVVVGLFRDADERIRIGAAKALWGVEIAADGRALIEVAQNDPSPKVREAAFKALLWPMIADIAVSNDAAIYDRAIDRALNSSNEHDVAGALTAYAFRRKREAEPVLRRFALDRRPAFRRAGIEAFDSITGSTPSICRFLESRLADPDERVREAVMHALDVKDDWAALPLVLKIAHSASSARERDDAREAAVGLRKPRS